MIATLCILMAVLIIVGLVILWVISNRQAEIRIDLDEMRESVNEIKYRNAMDGKASVHTIYH